MPYKPKRSLVERAATSLGLIKESVVADNSPPRPTTPPELRNFPDPAQWADFVEYDAHAWPAEARKRHYQLVPTVCFNCESACGLLAYVDKSTGRIRKFEGNPLHPGSRGKNCAKGPATINQVNDPDRILTPMKRTGPRGSGQWRAVSWDEALQDIGGRIRKALQENRRDEVVYHVGRPGSEGFIDRVLRAWGVDGHNSHTNICSAGARFGYAIWSGYDRPSPDYANARFILALNAHFESGHYFNPHAQRIREGMAKGCKLAVVDPRLSNTASQADHWLPTRPGTEAALLLSFAHVILEEGLYDKDYIRRWANWQEDWREAATERRSDGATMGEDAHASAGRSRIPAFSRSRFATVDEFLAASRQEYARFTPEYAAAECGVPAEQIRTIARLIADAGSRFCSHTWRGAASAHLGGWQVSRCLFFLHVLTGSVGTLGGTAPSAWHKFKANLIDPPPPQDHWNDLHWPREFPLAHYELSQLLPHFLKEGRGKLDVYFTRVFNPVWTYPDGFTWIEALRDESKIGLHIALTPTWNETAFFADYVLPMGHGPERHDLTTYETHSASWIAFRQPVLRAAARANGDDACDSRAANPGEVWEEDEFWIALCWAIDPDGSLGIRKYFQSPADSAKPLTVDEYYAHIFERVPGLPEAAAAADVSPLGYMRKNGAFEVHNKVYEKHERRLTAEQLVGAEVDPATGIVRKGGAPIGVEIDGQAVEGFPTPSRKLEFFSRTMAEWGWGEHAIPGYIESHVWEEGAEGRRVAGSEGGEGTKGKTGGTGVSPVSSVAPGYTLDACLLPTFRLPTLIHTRSGSAKWLNEISQRNPVWIHTSDARRLGVRTGDLVRVNTRIGYFVDRAWVCEAIRPGVVACSHHLGRWRRAEDPPNSRWSGAVVTIEEQRASHAGAAGKQGGSAVRVEEQGGGRWRLRTASDPGPFASDDPDSGRIWWRDGGVPQNLTFPVHPDPISGMHCWHQRVTVESARGDDRSGDVFVDTAKSMEVYREWMARARPPTGDLRRPLWLNRPLRPTDAAYKWTANASARGGGVSAWAR